MNSWCLDAASAAPSTALGTREAAAIIEVPAVPGSNQLPLEEVALWPPDADAPAYRAPRRRERLPPRQSGTLSPTAFPTLDSQSSSLIFLLLPSMSIKKPGWRGFLSATVYQAL